MIIDSRSGLNWESCQKLQVEAVQEENSYSSPKQLSYMCVSVALVMEFAPIEYYCIDMNNTTSLVGVTKT